MSNTLCAYPWNGAAIRPNGSVLPCCRYPHTEDPESFVWSPNARNSTSWVELRENMLAGKFIEGCKSCYQDELNGLMSMRLESISSFIPIKNEIRPLEKLEVALSNLCNSACAHCSSYFSTKWHSEDVRAGRVNKIGIIKNDFFTEHWNLSNISSIKIIGGEPFMEQKRFFELLKGLSLSNVNLQICTNGTILPNNELRRLIESCNNVYLCVSLDGIGTTNDWYRWPSKFTEVIENMQTYESWWGSNAHIVPIVHHVISAINIFELSAFIDLVKTDFPKWKIEWDWIRWPYWQELSSLPHKIKERLIREMSSLDNQWEENEFIDNPYKVTMARLQDIPDSDWDSLKAEVTKLSSERKLDFLNMVAPYNNIWYTND